MSAPPSPHVSYGNTPYKKKDRPPALDIPDDERKASSDGELRYGQGKDNDELNHKVQQHPSVHVSLAEEDLPTEQDYPVSRSTSATSSLDPYYFGLQSPSDSPVPPLPIGTVNLSMTPEQRQISEPVTPARDPAAIDRRGLVGVGELATPRWTRAEKQDDEPPLPDTAQEVDEYEVVVPEDVEEDGPDSPWTIEAVDGEISEREDPVDVQLPPRPLRTKPSIADESGGEEILYPRKLTAPIPDVPTRPRVDTAPQDSQPPPLEPKVLEVVAPSSPPSAFVPSVRKAKKRTSGEFEMDQFGALVSKQCATQPTKTKEEKSAVRKHRSLNVSSATSSPRDFKGKERRRESIGLTINSSMKSPSTKTPERHVRHTSTGSSSNGEGHPQRRVHATDFSHLPPSPSSSSIQQFLRQPTTSSNAHTPPLHKDNAHSSPNVAHSLLRGTQEGWSGLDDEATAEALRKLDGLSGKSARTRASVGSFVRSSSSSRPGTPAGKSGGQWEGVGANDSGKPKRSSGNVRDSVSAVKEREPRQSIGLGLAISDALGGNDLIGTAVSSDELPSAPYGTEKTPKKAGTASTRSSFTPKRGSTSSTTYTGTPSSRDSASMSTNTSMTSASGASGRHSTGKARRNSAGSDISSIHSSDATSLKDRVAALAVNSDAAEDTFVPPVPPLPKDLSSYRSPPSTSVSLTFPPLQGPGEREKVAVPDSGQDRTTSLEVPSFTSPPPTAPSPLSQSHRLSQHYTSGYTSVNSAPESAPAVPKTPSKKWSFSSALNLSFSSSPSSSSQKSGFPLSPRAVTFGQQVRKSTSKDHGISSSTVSSKSWETKQPDAMVSAGSLASLSSVGSVRTPALPSAPSKTPDRSNALSRTGTGSSGETNLTTSGLSVPHSGPLSPTASVRRGQSKRLTPSSIPFFRRSSSQSMQLPPSNSMATSSSPTLSSGNLSSTQARHRQSTPPRDQHNQSSTSITGSTHKKSSVLSLGLPSLLKSSSRRSLHSDSKEAAKELQKLKEAEKEKGRQDKLEKERQKKEDKDRSESRISVLMGGVTRKRGKTLSSTDPRKPKSPVNLPPMHMTALEPATAQRVARLKPSSNTNLTPTAQSTISRTASSTSRLTSQTVSSMQKQSDTSLRSRNQLPTIAGSPSVGTNGTYSSQTSKDFKEPPPSSLMNSVSGHPKETPTKIPRISSRTSAAASPPLKGSGSALSIRRTSANVNVVEPASTSTNPSPTGAANEFGVMEYAEETPAKTVRHSVRASPSMSTSRVPRQSMAAAATANNIRKGSRDSVSFTARKASTSSVTSLSTPAASTETSSHQNRFSALSPSKLKLLSPKILTARSSNAGQGIHQAMGSPSSSRQSLSTPSPAPSTVDEDELLGDEEMLHYIRRQQAKKMAAGATQAELDELLQFPEPLPPGTPSSPSSVIRNSSQHLSDYERKEILDYSSVYCFGAKSKKKLASPDSSSNNYGYDDERGDYLVVTKDHLAYRYEVIDTLGKGSFGQVLQCRDHCTGESVAVKIIRNKKRFHHQALVEIKILDSLRKWDSDGKHHVLKMIEHFYFRNHLCIATELLSINLYELIKANGFVGFTTALIRRFTSQMLMSLSLMRHHRIVHCDLKPENVLLRHPSKSAIKVIDFGSSCFETEKIYTYIQSRFYRSPEVILGLNYHMAIDMWSLGCILAELYTGFPIFPGENEQEQLSCIMEVLGVPDKEYVNRSSRKKLFFDINGVPRAVVNSKGRRRKPGTKTLQQVLRCTDEDFLDFISKCLIWDPERRIKPQAAMRHPFVSSSRRHKPPLSTTKTTASSSSLNNSRTKQLNETPKKSLISAPTPLTARSARTTMGAGGPITPSNSSHASSTLGSSSRSYRASQTQGLSSYSSRTLSGFASTATK